MFSLNKVLNISNQKIVYNCVNEPYIVAEICHCIELVMKLIVPLVEIIDIMSENEIEIETKTQMDEFNPIEIYGLVSLVQLTHTHTHKTGIQFNTDTINDIIKWHP